MTPPHGRRRPRALLAALLLTAACAAPAAEESADGTGSDQEPVTVDVCGEEVTYDQRPQRVLANDQNMVEMMLALGLEDRLVAATGVREELPAELDDALDGVDMITDSYVGDIETVLGTGADFVYAGWNYGFTDESGVTPDALADQDVDSYVLRESCRRIAPEMGPTTMEDVHHDARALGRIFGVQERAEELIEEWQDTVAAAEALVPDDAEPLDVFLYDSGEDEAVTAGGLAMPDHLIEVAGGENIAGDVEDTWVTISWEEVVERDPAYVPVMEYDGDTGADRIAHLTSTPGLADIDGVANERFEVFAYADMVPGIRSADTARRLAELLWSDANGEAS